MQVDPTWCFFVSNHWSQRVNEKWRKGRRKAEFRVQWLWYSGLKSWLFKIKITWFAVTAAGWWRVQSQLRPHLHRHTIIHLLLTQEHHRGVNAVCHRGVEVLQVPSAHLRPAHLLVSCSVCDGLSVAGVPAGPQRGQPLWHHLLQLCGGGEAAAPHAILDDEGLQKCCRGAVVIVQEVRHRLQVVGGRQGGSPAGGQGRCRQQLELLPDVFAGSRQELAAWRRVEVFLFTIQEEVGLDHVVVIIVVCAVQHRRHDGGLRNTTGGQPEPSTWPQHQKPSDITTVQENQLSMPDSIQKTASLAFFGLKSEFT